MNFIGQEVIKAVPIGSVFDVIGALEHKHNPPPVLGLPSNT